VGAVSRGKLEELVKKSQLRAGRQEDADRNEHDDHQQRSDNRRQPGLAVLAPPNAR
jgi:hypothetical protein